MLEAVLFKELVILNPVMGNGVAGQTGPCVTGHHLKNIEQGKILSGFRICSVFKVF